MAWRKRSEARYGRLAVPGADVLADIAAENGVSHIGTQIFGYSAAEFDGEI